MPLKIFKDITTDTVKVLEETKSGLRVLEEFPCDDLVNFDSKKYLEEYKNAHKND